VTRDRFLSALEVVYGTAGVLGAVATIPQAIKIWHTHADHIDALSLITWASYLLIAMIGLLYGILNKRTALVYSCGAYCFMYLIVVVGIAMETRSFW